MEIFSAVMLSNRHCGSLLDIINATENLDVFGLQPAYSVREYAAFLKDVEQDMSGMGMGKLENLQDNDPDMVKLGTYIGLLEKYFNAEC